MGRKVFLPWAALLLLGACTLDVPAHYNPFDPMNPNGFPFIMVDRWAGTNTSTNSGGYLIVSGFSFSNGFSLSIDSHEAIYVISKAPYPSQQGSYVAKYSAAGVFAWKTLPSAMYYPRYGAVASDGAMYCMDGFGNFETMMSEIRVLSTNGGFVRAMLSYGAPDANLMGPGRILADRDGTLLVADNRNHKLKRFQTNGTLVGVIGSNGNGPGMFLNPIDIVADADGRGYWVLELSNSRIQHISSNGEGLSRLGDSHTNASNNLLNPTFFCIYSNALVLVGDTGRSRIQWYSTTGVLLGEWSKKTDARFVMPNDLAVGPSGNLYMLYSNYVGAYRPRKQFAEIYITQP